MSSLVEPTCFGAISCRLHVESCKLDAYPGSFGAGGEERREGEGIGAFWDLVIGASLEFGAWDLELPSSSEVGHLKTE
jgi:hypothetical protein